MNDINPNNYDGVNTFIVGRAGGPVQYKEFPGGGSQAELSIGVSQGYKKDGEWVEAKTPTAWYVLTASTGYARENWPEIGKGDKVRVDNARQELREYDKKDGSTGLQVSEKYGTLTVVSRKGDNAPTTEPAESTGGFGEGDDTPW